MLSRTQLRRRQKKHSLHCFKLGAWQRASHEQEALHMLELLEDEELKTMAASVAIHRADCHRLHIPFHYAACSNSAAYAAQSKSRSCFKQHRLLHKMANLVKHDVDLGVIPTPPPPPPVEIRCEDLEAQLKAQVMQHAPAKGFVPFSGECFAWNTQASDFILLEQMMQGEVQCQTCGMIQVHYHNSCSWCETGCAGGNN